MTAERLRSWIGLVIVGKIIDASSGVGIRGLNPKGGVLDINEGVDVSDPHLPALHYEVGFGFEDGWGDEQMLQHIKERIVEARAVAMEKMRAWLAEQGEDAGR